jgi:hypothetical protein
MKTHGTSNSTAGFTLVEQTIALTLFAIVFLVAMGMVDSTRRFSTSTLGNANVQDLSQRMLLKIERELANARGTEPVAVLSASLPAAETATLAVDSTLGFPPSGTLILSRGTANEERIDYAFLDPNLTDLRNLTRGAQCTVTATHAVQGTVLWGGLAQPLDDQVAPNTADYDGIALDGNEQTFFRGDGTGFSYRFPVDPTGGLDFMDGDELTWGAEISGFGSTTAGWAALYFEPRTTLSEAEQDQDVNQDGDLDDVFDVGQIRRRTWSTADAANIQADHAMGPTAVLQEQCNYGGDLNGDGFADPLFLWNPTTNELTIRVFLLGRTRTNRNLIREVRSVLFLRNEPEQLQN